MVTSSPNIQIIKVGLQLKLALLDMQDLALFFETESKREIEKRAALYIVRKVLGSDTATILYKANGRPYLENSPVRISISHSHDKLAVLFSFNEKEVGVDVELIRDKVLRIKEKFLSPPELLRLQNAPVALYILYWAVKEAIYKAADIEGLIFSEQILVEPFKYNEGGGTITAVLKSNEVKTYILHYRKINEYMLVHTDNA